MKDGVVVLNGGDVWDAEELVKKYPITNTESWELLYPTKLTKGKHSFLVSKLMHPTKDPWGRTMKKWTFAALPIEQNFMWVKGYDPQPPISEEHKADDPLGYTTIEGRTVKLWRRFAEPLPR